MYAHISIEVSVQVFAAVLVCFIKKKNKPNLRYSREILQIEGLSPKHRNLRLKMEESGLKNETNQLHITLTVCE